MVDGEGKDRHPRITLMVAWWGQQLQAQPGTPGTGPARVLPSARGLLPQVSARRAARAETVQRQWSGVHAITPAWVSIRRDASQPLGKGAASALPLPCLRFALRSAGDINAVYMPSKVG